jgi:hypothetical protein
LFESKLSTNQFPVGQIIHDEANSVAVSFK